MIPSERDGKLASTLIKVLIAGLCDPGRLSRGRTYARQGAVDELHVEAGAVVGSVQGSRRSPYEVIVEVTPASPDASWQQLVPTARQLSFECTCPDSEVPCKHAVAVMTTFADVVTESPEALARWRGLASERDDDARAVVGSRARESATPRVRTPAGDAVPALSDEQREALSRFLEAPSVSPSSPSINPLVYRSATWDDPWSTMLDDALDTLANR